MSITIIAALDADAIIGHDNDLPWERIPADLRHFKDTTTGHVVVMGRKTFDSIGKPLPNRVNIVVTRETTFTAPGCEVVHSPEEILSRASTDDIYVIGGAQMYATFLPHADLLLLTFVDTKTGGSIRFPEVAWDEWTQTENTPHPKGTDSPYDLRFTAWKRNS